MDGREYCANYPLLFVATIQKEANKGGILISMQWSTGHVRVAKGAWFFSS